MPHISRKIFIQSAFVLFAGVLGFVRRAEAFGQASAFHPRIVSVRGAEVPSEYRHATSRWSWELIRRTSAPARLAFEGLHWDQSELFQEPFVIWVGSSGFDVMNAAEERGLRQFIHLGGVILVDDFEPERGEFSKAARQAIARALPAAAIVRLPENHVIYKSYYILERPEGRVSGPAYIEAIVRGKAAQVLFLRHDLLGAMAYDRGRWLREVRPGGTRQRELATRLAVNLAMYVLCSDYKNDQVHAPWLMRRRGGGTP